jgi:hypothetical protein
MGNECDDFLDGQRDCQEGTPADMARSEDYQRGYATEYARGEMITNFREKGLWVSGKH